MVTNAVEKPVGSNAASTPEGLIMDDEQEKSLPIQLQPEQAIPVPLPVAPPRSNTATLVLGILSVIFWLLPIVGLPISIVGLVLSCIRRHNAGIVLNLIGLILSIINILLAIFISLLS